MLKSVNYSNLCQRYCEEESRKTQTIENVQITNYINLNMKSSYKPVEWFDKD